MAEQITKAKAIAWATKQLAMIEVHLTAGLQNAKSLTPPEYHASLDKATTEAIDEIEKMVADFKTKIKKSRL